MIRRARLSVKPNVRPGVGARAAGAAVLPRGREPRRPPEPAEPPEVPEPPETPAAEPPEKAPERSDEKVDGGNDVEESSQSPAVPQRRKRVSGTSGVLQADVTVPSERPPVSTANEDAAQPDPVPAKEKAPCSDRYRIYKARKLREMLKEELRKEKKQWKNKCAISECQKPLDRSKMTMRDFIYYLPESNPMTSSLEQEKKTEKALPSVQTKEQENKNTADAEGSEELEEETDEGPLLVPRVKVAEDGSIILDEESLTVEVLRTKGPCVVEENDPIFERGSTTTYSSFRKSCYSKPWSNKETDMFFLAISMVGTDFSMIGQLFPHRARTEIKNKFKREERTNGWRIDKAFQEKRPFDFDFFAHLLQKVLAEEEKRKQKSVKSHSVKEKEASKSTKHVKAKKVVSEDVINGAEESVSVDGSAGSPRGAQAAPEETVSSEQASEQAVSGQEMNQKKRRRKTKDETNNKEIKSPSGSGMVQSGLSKGEKLKSKSLLLEPAETETVCGERQESSCVQSVDVSICQVSGQETPEDTDANLPFSDHQGAVAAAGESSDFPPSGVEVSAACAPDNAEAGCAEETDVGTKNKSVDTEQTENVKLVSRSRLQRPKPSLSRALGKKAVLSQDKTGAERKSSLSETSVETSHVEKATKPMCDGDGMEHPEGESLPAEPASELSEKVCLQEVNSPKALKPARLMRGRLQRPKPNVGKGTERKPQTSQEKLGATAEETQTVSCVDGGISQQVEDQSRENVECGDVTSGPERKDSSGEIPSDEPKAVSDSVSVQENVETNIHKQVPSQRSRFQKAKPNIVRGAARREICSKEVVPEEILVSEEMTASLRESVGPDSLPSGEAPVEVSAVEELESRPREAGGSILSPREKIPEMDDIIVDMEVSSEITARETSLREEVSEVRDVTKGTDMAVQDAHTGEGPPQEDLPEQVTVTVDTEADLKRVERQVPPSEMFPEMTDAMEETEEVLEGTELATQIKAPEGIRTTGDVETDPEGIREVSQRENVLVEASEEMEFHLEEHGKKDISLSEEVSGKLTAVQHAGATWEQTGRAVSLEERPSENMIVLEGAGEEKPEETSPAGEAKLDSLQSSSADQRATVPLPGSESAGCEVLSGKCSTAVEGSRGSGKEGSSPFPDVETRSQVSADVSEKDERELPPPDAGKQFSDATLSISLPQEQKPVEVKPAPFVRSRFKRPKPNLARAVLKREAVEAAKCVPGEESESGKTEAGAAPGDGQQAPTLPCQHAVASLVTSREKDTSARLPWSEPAKGRSPPASSEPAESSQSAPIQPHDAITSSGIQSKNAIQQETKESVTQTVQPIRGRLQRPRPNLRKAGQREIQKGEASSVIQKETAILKNDDVNDKSLSMPNSQIGAEIEAVSSKVSECRIYENEGHDVVPVEDVQVNKMNILAEEMRHENKLYVPSPEQLIKEKFQTTQLDLGAARCEKEEPEGEKDTTEQPEASSPDDGAQQLGAQQLGAQQLGAQQLRAQQLGAQHLGAQQLGAQQLGAHHLGAQQLGAHHLGAQQLGAQQHLGAQQLGAQQHGAQQLGAQQLSAQQLGAQQLGAQQLGAQQLGAQQLGAQHLGTQQLGAQQLGAQQLGAQQLGAQQLGAQQLGAQQLGAQHLEAQQLGAQQLGAQQLGAQQHLGVQHLGAHHLGAQQHLGTQQLGAQQLGAQQLGVADPRLLPKEKAEFLTSLEVCTGKDDAGAAQSPVAEQDARLGAGGDGCPHPLGESQPLRTPASCLQLTNESNYSKIAADRTLTISSGSESKTGHNKRRIQRNVKPNVTKGRGCKRIRGRPSKREPKTSRSTLVTLRAGQEEEEDDAEEFDFTEEETCHLAPEEVNKAPVFVPLGLRSPEPVSAQIEETMEEFEITVNVPDMECIVVVEPQLPTTDVTAQEMEQEENGNAPPLEVTSSVHTQDEPGTNDGSAEAAIALLTMGDLVLQSEIGAEQGDGVCVLTDACLEDKSQAPFGPDNVHVRVDAECRGPASPVTSTAPESREENKIVLEEQSTREEVGLVEKVKATATPTRSTASKMSSNLRMRSRFAKPKPNLKQASRTNRLLKEDASLCVTQEVVTETQIETEEGASETAEVEDKSLGPMTLAGSGQQSRVECARARSETGVAQEAHTAERNEEEEEGSEVVLMSPVAPLVSSLEPALPMLAVSQSSGEGPLRQESAGGGVLALQVPQQCTSANVAEVHHGNVISSQDLTGLMAADIRQEDEQAFILTLVEIPTSAAAEFTDPTAQSVPASLLPAPILVTSASSDERADGSVNLPVTSLHQGAMYLPVSERDGSENSPGNLDLTTRKRFRCSLEESNQVPPAKKSSLTSRILHQEYASGVCSAELMNVLDETGESCKGRTGSPTLGSSLHPDPPKEHLESACQSLVSGTVNEITNPHGEKSVPQCPRVEVTQEERTDAACVSPQVEKEPATKPPLSRPHRKPLGFLSLICSKKTSLGSDEPTQVHRKKRLKPLIPAARQIVKRSDPPSEIQETRQESRDALPAPSVHAGSQPQETRQESCDTLLAPNAGAGSQPQETRQESHDMLLALNPNVGSQPQETRQESCDTLLALNASVGSQPQETRRELRDVLPAPSVDARSQPQETRQDSCDALPAPSVDARSQSQETGQDSRDTFPAPNADAGSQPENSGESAAQVQVSCDEVLLREERESGQHAAPTEEPTTVAEYFFNDIFIEVDEAE